MLGEIRADHADLLEAIRSKQEVTPEVDKALVEFLDRFVKTFV
jgi:F0F1-type ATP synthase alpha subunit